MESLKPVQKQLKTLIPSMSQSDLNKITRHLQNVFNQEFVYTTKQLSYKCHEATLSFRGKKSTGYGRTEQDAHLNAIKNLLEILIEEDDIVFILKQQMKGSIGINLNLSINNYVSQEGNKENEPRGFVTKPSINLSTASTQSHNNNDGKKSKSLIKPIHVESLNISMLKTLSNNNTKSPSLEQELRSAKLYILQLQQKIRTIEQQNKHLKNKNFSTHLLQSTTSHFTGTSSVNLQLYHHQQDQPARFSLKGREAKQPVYVRNEKMNHSVQEVVKNNNPSQETELRKSDVKQKVPKLKLSMLPSYHGKSNKSMNQSMVVVKQDK